MHFTEDHSTVWDFFYNTTVFVNDNQSLYIKYFFFLKPVEASMTTTTVSYKWLFIEIIFWELVEALVCYWYGIKTTAE